MISLTQLGAHLCRPDASIREVLARINVSPNLFQVVVDEQGRLLGTVTDGDVRRAILRGINLDDPVEACMHRDAKAGVVGAAAENLKILRTMGDLRAFMPVLDADGVVREILVSATGEAVASPPALVMAGGRGSRLGDRTHDTPKPLLPVGERPILDRVITRIEDAGIEQVYVAVHYLADQIERFVEDRRNKADVRILRENSPLGTAGAIGQVPKDGQSLLVLNGDVLTNVDIPAFIGFHQRHDHEATIAVALHETSVPFGVVRHGEDGTFLGVEEKPSTTYFVAAGIYLLAPEMTAMVPPRKRMDMPDLLNLGRAASLRIGLFPIHEYWVDVGRPEDLRNADDDHLRGLGG